MYDITYIESKKAKLLETESRMMITMDWLNRNGGVKKKLVKGYKLALKDGEVQEIQQL